MKIYELVIKICVLDKTTREEAIHNFVDIIDDALCLESEGKKLHDTNNFKNYSVSEVYPIKDTYCIDDICVGRIRSVDKSLVDLFKKNLDKRNVKGLVVDNVEVKELNQQYIYSLKTSSACVITIPGVKGYWRGEQGVYEGDFENQLIMNLTKKYNKFTGESIGEVRFSDVFVDYKFHHSFIKKRYKNITLLGDVVTLYPNNTEIAQKLCNFALGVGIGTRNTRTMGFVDAIYL